MLELILADFLAVLRGEPNQSWLSIAVLLFAAYSTVSAQTAPQLAQRTFPSVVMIVTSDASGQPLALGSGFSVGDAIIATNMHVIEGASTARIKVIGRSETYAVSGVIGTDAKADLALLKVNGLDAPSISLGDSKQVAVGEQVFAVGNPEGLEGTFSEGIVSGIRKVDANTLLQITAPISPGSSGGPVIDSTGKVLGIAVATFKEGQNLNFAVPVSYLKALIGRDAGAVIRPLAAIAAQSSSQSVVAQMGSAATESVTGEEFLWGEVAGQDGHYSFTLINHLQQPVSEVSGVVIFCAEDGTPLDTEEFSFQDDIPPGLAKRLTGQVDTSVAREMGADWVPKGKEEFRILNFKIAQAAPAQPSPPADSPVATPPAQPEEVPDIAREYFQGLYRAGGLSNGAADHVCFSDDSTSDSFFTFGALAYDKHYTEGSNLTVPNAAYINLIPDNNLKRFPKKWQTFYEKGGQTLVQYVYGKGVKVNQFVYRWNGNTWIAWTHLGGWTSTTYTIRDLLIEPTTMRYEESGKTETKYGPNAGVQNLGTRYGVCEKVPTNK